MIEPVTLTREQVQKMHNDAEEALAFVIENAFSKPEIYKANKQIALLRLALKGLEMGGKQAAFDVMLEALQRLTYALENFRDFENKFPNNSGNEWERLFNEKEFAEDAARAAIAQAKAERIG